MALDAISVTVVAKPFRKAPITNLQSPENHQTPITEIARDVFSLELGYWGFFGAWLLVLGTSVGERQRLVLGDWDLVLSYALPTLNVDVGPSFYERLGDFD